MAAGMRERWPVNQTESYRIFQHGDIAVFIFDYSAKPKMETFGRVEIACDARHEMTQVIFAIFMNHIIIHIMSDSQNILPYRMILDVICRPQFIVRCRACAARPRVQFQTPSEKV